jgi:hypothetical protein
VAQHVTRVQRDLPMRRAQEAREQARVGSFQRDLALASARVHLGEEVEPVRVAWREDRELLRPPELDLRGRERLMSDDIHSDGCVRRRDSRGTGQLGPACSRAHEKVVIDIVVRVRRGVGGGHPEREHHVVAAVSEAGVSRGSTPALKMLESCEISAPLTAVPDLLPMLSSLNGSTSGSSCSRLPPELSSPVRRW